MINRLVKRAPWLLIIAFLPSCSVQGPMYSIANMEWEEKWPAPADTPLYSVILLGDPGKLKEENDPTLALLDSLLPAAGKNSATVSLGDNIYTYGLPPVGAEGRDEAEERSRRFLDAFSEYKGKLFLIPGNHDWKRSLEGGWEQVRRQERFVENYLDHGNIWRPDNGCPGPVEIPLDSNIVLILLDTEWWLHPFDKPTDRDGLCDITNRNDFVLQLRDMLRKNKDKQIIVGAHHPLITNGTHGGRFPVTDHIFPFRALNSALFIPMPIIGSIYPLYRRYLGNIQDLSHPDYQDLQETLFQLFELYPNIIYAAGHEHNLQYSRYQDDHHLVSGSACKVTYIARGPDADFLYAHLGLMQIDFMPDRSVWLKVFASADKNEPTGLVFRKLLFKVPEAPALVEKATVKEGAFIDSTVTIPAGESFRAASFKRFWLGDHYRDAWTAPVDVKVMDMSTYDGGLRPMKRGGGMSTKSLRLSSPDGNQHIFRSILKSPQVLPEGLENTLADAVVRDQVSALHPYGAFSVPVLADAAGVFHTTPVLRFIPEDPLLGNYDDFNNTLVLVEERPNEDETACTNFGCAPDVKGTNVALEDLQKDNDYEVDEHAVLRARLLDMLLGDWDRHDDQWRWAYFEKDKGALLLPIPRDRDAVFHKFDGLLPWIIRREWLFPKLSSYTPEIESLRGLNYNARYFDRTFLTGLSRQDWILEAQRLQQLMTNKTIDSALSVWPDTIYDLTGPAIKETLLQRREDLVKYAIKYYEILAKEVDIAGSDKHEYFEVERLNNDETEVTVWKTTTDKGRQHLIYHRVFKTGETNEIRLYGRGGNDTFIVSGHVNKGIKVRIIGGGNSDLIIDSSRVSGLSKKTVIYDTETGNKIIESKETKDKTMADPAVNRLERTAFEYDLVAPASYFQYNIDDGVLIGGGVQITTEGFRKDPYKTRHRILGNFAFLTHSFNFKYSAEFNESIGNKDFIMQAHAFTPRYAGNYFGMGNETEKLGSLYFHRIRYDEFLIQPGLRRRYRNNHHLQFNLNYLFNEVRETDNTFIASTQSDQPESVFTQSHWLGANGQYSYHFVDSEVNPKRGIRFKAQAGANQEIAPAPKQWLTLNSEFTVYITLIRPLVLANRWGGGTNIGQFDFYQAQTLGGPENLRGYRRTRFYGHSRFYQNTELRLHLFNFKSILFPGHVGLIGHYDYGRVWVQDEISDKWHQGYGGGVWISPLNKVIFSGTYTFSEDETNGLLNVKLGFFF
ncbi:MAG: BamA/TamA family outer membrane protein [Bacteroidia bacterium]